MRLGNDVNQMIAYLILEERKKSTSQTGFSCKI